MSETVAPVEEYANIKKWLLTLPSVTSMDKLGGSMEDASNGYKGKLATSQSTLDAAATLSRMKGEKSKKWDKWDQERESGILADMDAGSVPKPLTKKPDNNNAAPTTTAAATVATSPAVVAVNLTDSPTDASPKSPTAKTPASALLKVNLCTDSSSQVHSITNHQFFGSSVAITSALGSASSIDNYRTASHDQESYSLPSDGTGSGPSYAYSRPSTQIQPRLSRLSHMQTTSSFYGNSSGSNNQLFPSEFSSKKKITAKDINSSINSIISKETTNSLLADEVLTRPKSSNSSFNKGGELSDSDDSAGNHTSAFSLAVGRRSQLPSTGSGGYGKPYSGNATAKHLHSESFGTKLATTSGPNDLNNAGNVTRSVGNSESSSLEQLQSNHGGSLPNLNDLSSSRSSNLQGSLPDHPSSSTMLQPTPVDVACSSENMGDESQNAFLRKIRHAKIKTDSKDSRDFTERSPHASSLLVGSDENNEYLSARSSISDSRSFSISSDRKRVTAAMLNIGQSESGSISENSSVQSLNSPHYRTTHIQAVDSCSNLAVRASNGRTSIGLEELKKEFLSGPTNLHVNPSGEGSFKGKAEPIKSILKPESAPKSSPPPVPAGVSSSHPSLNEGTARVKWGKTRVYMFEQTDEEISLRGGGGSKKDKKRDLMRV
ncbi:hypothetical protein HDU81_000207 [Chytriomyces hyalinus]|nr:hypothetical protein HDU81_000207 [Chytriomyces hyalinus]